MERTGNRLRKLSLAVLCVLLALSFAVSASAEKTISVFTATDRHSAYETTAAESEENKESSSSKERARMPVYDADGSLIWHNNLTDLLSRVRRDEAAVQPEIILLGGDNVGSGSDKSIDKTGYPMGAPPFSMKAVDAQIAHVFGDTTRGVYTYGSHDNNETGNYADIFFSGSMKCDGFYLYGISFSQMIHETDGQAKTADEKGRTYSGKDLADPKGISAQTAAHHFLSWVKGLRDHWPIIVISHVPLHANRGDNSGAHTWTWVLNQAAMNHDVVFLWGHNHTLERSEKAKAVERAHYLLLPGEEITVQSRERNEDGKIVLRKAIDSPAPDGTEEEKKPKYELITHKETLRFVYMNAGYIIDGVGSLLTLTDTEEDGEWDRLTVKRYMLDSEKAEEWDLPLRKWNQQP